jgi:cytochrome o ubiquinol oxidase operon protein cyoD
MSHKKLAMVGHFEPPHGSLQSYVTAFIGCIVISVVAYVTATSNIVSNRTAVVIIAGLAIIQAVIQLQYFLHVGDEYKPRWKLWIFILMITIAAIVVGGSLWIMDNLNYRMIHSSDQMQEYVESQDGL